MRWWSRDKDLEDERADRVRVDPSRPLPSSYDVEGNPGEDAEDRAHLAREYVAGRNLRPLASGDKLARALTDLPALVARDVIAATTKAAPPAAGTVAAVFERAARLLGRIRVYPRDASATVPTHTVERHDAEFIEALRTQIAAGGGAVTLPFVPRLPAWVDDADREVAPSLGWLRVSVGYTSGERIRDPDCRSIRSGPPEEDTHLPWWQVLLERPDRICGVCGGPGLRDLVRLTALFCGIGLLERARPRSY